MGGKLWVVVFAAWLTTRHSLLMGGKVWVLAFAALD